MPKKETVRITVDLNGADHKLLNDLKVKTGSTSIAHVIRQALYLLARVEEKTRESQHRELRVEYPDGEREVILLMLD